MGKIFVSDLRDGERVKDAFLVAKKAMPVTKAGKPYLNLTLQDRSGEIEARVWDNAEELEALFARHDYVLVDARAESWQGKLQLKVDAVKRLDPAEVDAADFLPATRYDVAEMFREVSNLVDGVRNAFVRTLLRAFLDDPEIGPAFRRAPAAKGIHHPFLGGLCEHTLSVMQLAHRIADHYPRLDRDLLVAGAMLHDIGKVKELTFERAFDYSDVGRLVGHLVLTTQWIHEKAARIPGFPPELEVHLVHLVVAHHGELEHGSPKLPQTLEAMVVHALDELDSRVNSWSRIIDQYEGARWTEYQRLYDRYLFRGPSWSGEAAEPGERWTGKSMYAREAEAGPVREDGVPSVAPGPSHRMPGVAPVPAAPRVAAEREPAAVPAEEPALAFSFARSGRR